MRGSMITNLNVTFFLAVLLFNGCSALLRQAPSVEIRPALQPDDSEVKNRLDRIEAKIEAAAKSPPMQIPMQMPAPYQMQPPMAYPVQPDNTRLQNDLERHAVREEEEQDRVGEMERLASKKEDAREEGKLKGLAQASLDATANVENEAAGQLQAEESILKKDENDVEASEEATEKEVKAEESDEEERHDREEEREAEKSEHEVISGSDLSFEDENVASLENADKTVEEAEGLANALENKDEAEADKGLKQALKAEKRELETGVAEATGLAGDGGKGQSEQTTISTKACATGAMDQPCPCIEEMMKEPCPSKPEGGGGAAGTPCEAEGAATTRLREAEDKLIKVINHHSGLAEENSNEGSEGE